jgi:hypothetical protein
MVGRNPIFAMVGRNPIFAMAGRDSIFAGPSWTRFHFCKFTRKVIFAM